jgi:DNA-directed RNA polymerase
MQELTPLEYLKIDVANQFGLDKLTWDDRLDWVSQNQHVLEAADSAAESPILYRKAVRALRRVEAGLPTNHVMGLDATASGPQFLSAMSGCVSGSRAVNVINTGKREDLYTNMDQTMSNLLGMQVGRSALKKPVMVYFYGSQAVPKQIFGDDSPMFFKSLEDLMPGATSLMHLFQGSWKMTPYWDWVMPDGHHVHIPVTETEEKGVEIDEADHFRFTFRCKVVKPQAQGRSLAANITHSVDAWACRQMVRRAERMGFQLAPIHDCFFTSPKYMQQVRELYRDILIEVHERNLVQYILRQIVDPDFQYQPLADISSQMSGMEYALS